MDTKKFKMKEIFRILNSPEFMHEVPKYANARETHANIKLMSSALICFHKGYLTLREISESIKAFQLIAKETKVGERIPLTPAEINKVLRVSFHNHSC